MSVVDMLAHQVLFAKNTNNKQRLMVCHWVAITLGGINEDM